MPNLPASTAAPTREGIRATYLVCVGRAGDLDGFVMPGVERAMPCRVVRENDLACVLCEVFRDDFEDGASLQDVEWIVPRAEAHERIVTSVRERGPVLPIRFGSLFECDERAREIVANNAESIAEFLDRTSDADEYTLKVFVDRKIATERCIELALKDQLASLPSSPGARYVAQKKLAKEAATRADAMIEALLAQVEQVALSATEGVTTTRPARGDDPSAPIMHVSCLVQREHAADVPALVEKLEATFGSFGLTFSATGPWPVYSFVPELELNVDG